MGWGPEAAGVSLALALEVVSFLSFIGPDEPGFSNNLIFATPASVAFAGHFELRSLVYHVAPELATCVSWVHFSMTISGSGTG